MIGLPQSPFFPKLRSVFAGGGVALALSATRWAPDRPATLLLLRFRQLYSPAQCLSNAIHGCQVAAEIPLYGNLELETWNLEPRLLIYWFIANWFIA